MWTVQLGLVGWTPVPGTPSLLRAASGHGLDSVPGRVDPPDHLVLRIDHIDKSFRPHADAIGAVKAGGTGGAAIAGESLGAVAGKMVQGSLGQWQFPDTVSFPQGNPERALVKTECPRPENRVPACLLPLAWESPFRAPGDRADLPARQIDLADPVVADVGNVETALSVQGNTVWHKMTRMPI